MMDLGQLIDTLEAYPDQSAVLPRGFHNPHSYRGYYECLAFEPVSDVSVAEMLQGARGADGEEYTAWKGGQYLMTRRTDVYLAVQGCTGDELSSLLLDYMLVSAAAPQRGASATGDVVVERALRSELDALATMLGVTVEWGELSSLLGVELVGQRCREAVQTAATKLDHRALIPSIEWALFGTEDGALLSDDEATVPLGELRRLLREEWDGKTTAPAHPLAPGDTVARDDVGRLLVGTWVQYAHRGQRGLVTGNGVFDGKARALVSEHGEQLPFSDLVDEVWPLTVLGLPSGGAS